MTKAFHSLLLAGVVVGGAVTVGVEAASAASLSGSISLSGGIEVAESGNVTTFDFDNDTGVSTISNATGDFASVVSTADKPIVTDLTFIDGIVSAPVFPHLIDFGEQTIDGVTALLSFNVTSDIELAKDTFFGVVDLFSGPLQGAFTFDGETVAVGGLTANRVPGSSSYSISITADAVETVPEPLTILGSGAALGIGAFLKRRKAKAA